jgi:predicted nucleotidyltransferase
MNTPLETILAELRSRFEALYGPRLDRLILFGSQARGDADEESDIDVMVVLKEPVEDREAERVHCRDITADMSLKYNTLITAILTDSSTYRSSDYSLYKNVRREGVAV